MKVIKTLCMCALCILMFFESAQTIHAEENTEYQYYLEKNSTSNKYWYGISFNLNNPETQKPVAWLSRDSNGKVSWVRYCVYDTSITANTKKSFPSKHVTTNSTGEETVTNNYQINVRAYNVTDVHENTSCVFNSDGNVNTNIPLFNSHTEAVNYMLTGSTDGWLNKPEIDYSVEHDFTTDTYRTDIPIPEVSNMDFNSFKLTNWEEQYFVDIIIENRFLEVAIMNNTGNGWKKIFKPTGAKTYNWHYWNLMCHGAVFNQADIDIPTLYGFDPQEALIEDFKAWSEEYPDLSDIDGYDFTMIAQKNDYKERHVYDLESTLTDEEQLRNSGQGMCIYWIRYALEDGTYGQWVKYTIHDYDVNAKDNDEWEDKTTVSTQIVGVNKDTGRVEHSNALSGTIDKDDNSLSYGNDFNVGEVDANEALSKFMDFLNAIMSGLGQVPEFIARCFSFLPQWCTNLLGGMIVWCVIMRVLGR